MYVKYIVDLPHSYLDVAVYDSANVVQIWQTLQDLQLIVMDENHCLNSN